MTVKQYRTEYPGEFVITNTVFRNGKKEQEREWIENPIQNESINHRACCVGPGESIEDFPLERLEKHSGGVLGRDKMQLYGVEEIWERMKSDFLIVLDSNRLDEIKETGMQVDNVVYTSARLCINNPGEFYLIPHSVKMLSLSTAVWIACFDGHKEIYLFGYDKCVKGIDQIKMIATVADIMQTFDDVTFYHITNSTSPDAWRQCRNLKTRDVNYFISYCDI